jgi:hypothetical protein
MPATMQCKNGHTFEARIIEDDPTINSFVVEPDICPECDSSDCECIEVTNDFSDLRDEGFDLWA